MAYPPGSFSKNFGWHGTGFRKLHDAVNAGFGGTLNPADRRDFRARCGLAGGIDLIPINFFLHNRDGKLSVDELVYRAVRHPHDSRFDRLGLFAFHLNGVGSGRDPVSGRAIVSRPAMWANEFVRERLWAKGTWQTDALSNASLDSFFASHVAARPEVREKCKTNYRHMFRLCRYWPSSLPALNSRWTEWLSSALFLAWDRYSLDGARVEKPSLLQVIENDEIYKMLGVAKNGWRREADGLVDLYISVGGLDRFRSAPSSSPIPGVPGVPGASGGSGQKWLELAGDEPTIERRIVEHMERKRDRRIAAALKSLYDNTCMFCGEKLRTGENAFYSEAAHIKPLGRPHDGPDKIANMLVLCPNHHLQFDKGVMGLQEHDSGYTVFSTVQGDPVHGKTLRLLHDLDNECVDWHAEWFKLA